MHYPFDIVTTVNIFLTLINVICTINSTLQAKKQTSLMEKQLEPDFALTGKLESITKAINRVGDKISSNSSK